MARRLTLTLVAATLLATAFLPVASAHTHVEVADGKYELTVGWKLEPPFAGVKNGLDLRVERILEESDNASEDGHGHGNSAYVAGLHENLTITYEYAGRSFEPVEFRGAHGQPGHYTAEITPTRPGQYTIHIVGDIEGHPIDVRVEPAEIEPLAETMFPVEDPTAEDLQMEIDDLKEQVADLEAKIAALQADAQSNANTPTDPSSETNDTPAPGLLLGALAAVGAALVLRRR